MNYVRSISGSVSKTWNSINPATLSGAIDVIVVQHDDGTLACSPFHVRFGKLSLLRPYEKKVEFSVNGSRQDYSMKLGEGGEAFFVFQTSANVPENLQTSPLISPTTSPTTRPTSSSSDTKIPDPEPLSLDDDTNKDQGSEPALRPSISPMQIPDRRAQTELGSLSLSRSFPGESVTPGTWPAQSQSISTQPNLGAETLPARPLSIGSSFQADPQAEPPDSSETASTATRSRSPPSLPKHQALMRALTLSKKLRNSNIPSQVNDEGDLMLDMTGYKSSEEDSLRAEVVARQILSEEVEEHYDIGSLIGADEKGNLWIYSSEEAKDAASKKILFGGMAAAAMVPSDASSDPGYQSDDSQSQASADLAAARRQLEHKVSDSAIGMTTPPDSPGADSGTPEPSKNYAKTLRLTSDQLKGLNLKPGANPMSFTVNRATCQANMYLWRYDVPIVVSDVDGTITKSDALGHVLNMIGRDWTHLGVAKLFSDIVANGYNILYLTSRSVGQADSTRNYLTNISQEGFKLPKGAVIMSPDRTLSALRREVYLRKPEVFKMACLRDIMSLFAPHRKTPFYAGFGNRLTDALSYRSVNIPATRIFTIDTNAEVRLHLPSLNSYKTAYTSMRDTIDHFFPPVGMLLSEGGEEFTDFKYWRDDTLGLEDFELSESESEDDEDGRLSRHQTRRGRSGQGRSHRHRGEYDGSVSGEDDELDEEDEEDEDEDDEVFSDELGESYISQDSLDRGGSFESGRGSGELPPMPSIDDVATGGLPESGVGGGMREDEYHRESTSASVQEGEADDELDLIAEAAGRDARTASGAR